MKTIKNTVCSVFLLGLLLSLTGCLKPAKVDKYEEIGPNETVWVIPLTGPTLGAQSKFDSVAFLEQQKVQSKRIFIPLVEKKVGRWPNEIQWIDGVKVIRVDRSLVTREWTDNTDTGTTQRKEGIQVVTKDSIQLTVGLTITCSIEETNSSRYLYYHGERKLSDVVDNNVRSFCVAELTSEYSKLNLTQAQTNGPTIYTKLFQDAKAAFETRGVSIQYLGNAEGIHYANKEIQDAINRKFMAEQSIETAHQEQLAQKMRNETAIQKAEAEATAAKSLFAAQEATRFNNELEVRLLAAKAQYAMATNWNGHLPANILPANSPLLMNLGNVGVDSGSFQTNSSARSK